MKKKVYILIIVLISLLLLAIVGTLGYFAVSIVVKIIQMIPNL